MTPTHLSPVMAEADRRIRWNEEQKKYINCIWVFVAAAVKPNPCLLSQGLFFNTIHSVV